MFVIFVVANKIHKIFKYLQPTLSLIFKFCNHCAMHMLHYIAALRIICLGNYFKKIPARKIPTSGVDVPDPPGVLSIILSL